MRSRLSFWRLLLSVIALLALFSSGCIKAHAALPSGGKFLTAQEVRNILGDSITGRYYNGSAYVDVTYRYLHSELINQLQQQTASDIVTNNLEVVVYAADISSVGLNPSYITFDLQPEFQILNTSYIYSFIGHNMSTGISSSVYSPPRWEWFLNGRTTVFQDANLLNPNGTEYAHFRTNNSVYYTYAEMAYTSNEPTSGYSLRASFFGNNPQNTARLAVGLPYVSSSGSGESGTMPTGVTTIPSTNITVNVDVDMTETNSILDNILSGIGGLVNGVKDLFVPDSEDIQDFKNDVASILDNSFSGYSDAEDYIDQATQILVSSNPSAVISFPAIDIPYTNMHFAARTVDLNYNSDHIEFIKTLVDIIFTLAFINMIMNKHHAILVGEKVVDVEGAELNDY